VKLFFKAVREKEIIVVHRAERRDVDLLSRDACLNQLRFVRFV
jgi:hypothetical protein